jgi:hypothetical protein
VKTAARYRPLLVAFAALAFWAESWSGFGGRERLHQYDVLSLCALSGNEAVFYAGVAITQLFFAFGLGLFLARSWGGWGDRIAGEIFARPRIALAALSAAGGLLALLVALAVVREHSITEDEKTYIFQAKLLLMGRMSIDVPPQAATFWEPYLVGIGPHWSGQYFWAQPALLALGLLAHAPYAVPAIEVAGTVFFSGLLVDELTGDRRATVLAGALVATSPILVLTGATLNNANLSAACCAVTLFSLARLHKRADRTATIALALSTAVGLHNRLLDHTAILIASAIVLGVTSEGARIAMVKRLVPAVLIALPFLALHAAFNRAVSGDWRHSGYWLQDQVQRWTMLGFGTGAGGFPQDASTASSKTIANAVRMLFYTAGGPLAFAPVAIQALRGERSGILRAAGATTALYFGAYFLYASASTQTTGPVYFDALVPVLAGTAAIATVRTHDLIADAEPLRRAVPALVVAQIVGAFLLFFPPAALEVGRAADDSAHCDELASELDPTARALVFVAPARSDAEYRSLTDWQPMPSPTFDDRILFPRAAGPEKDSAVFAQFGAGRETYLAHCVAEAKPRIERYDPATGRVWPATGAAAAKPDGADPSH